MKTAKMCQEDSTQLIGEEGRSFVEMDLSAIKNMGVVVLAVIILCLPPIELSVKVWIGMYAFNCLGQVILLAVAIMKDDPSCIEAFKPINIFVTSVWWIFGINWIVSDILSRHPPFRMWLVALLFGYHVFFYAIFCVGMRPCSRLGTESEEA